MFQLNPLGGFGYTFVLLFKVGIYQNICDFNHIVFLSVSFSGFFLTKIIKHVISCKYLLYALRSLAVTGSLFRVASLVIWKISLTLLMRHFEIKKSSGLWQIA
jgi:hypothetical protein